MRNVIGVFAFVSLIGAAAHGQALLATGGAGDSGGNGGGIDIRASDAVVAGGKAKAKAPKAPKVTTKPDLTAADLDVSGTIDIADLDASPSDLDPDDFEVTVRGDVLVPAGATLRVENDSTIVSTQGGVFVVGNIVDNDGSNNGVDLDLASLRKAVVIQGNIDLDGEAATNGGDGGNLDLAGAQVSISGSALVSTQGGVATGGGNDGGDGGNVSIHPSSPVIQGKISIALGSGTTVDLRGGGSGTGGGADGGQGGDFSVNYSDVLGNPTPLTLAGRVDVRGGQAQAGAGTGGDAGRIRADVGGALAVSGVLDARGGAGASGANGGDGGDIALGSRGVGKGPITILVPGSTTVNADASGGAGAAGQGGDGGSLSAEADLRGIQWDGSLSVAGGSSVGDDGADGGDLELMSWGPASAPVRVGGSLSAQGSDANGDGNGSAGGDITVVALDGDVTVAGSVNTSAGNAVGGGNNADPAGAGDVFLLADDTNGDPSTGVNGDSIDLLDNVGGDIFLQGNVTATGGNGGGGSSDGSNGGRVTIDADGDDGEQSTNGTVVVSDGVSVSSNGGNGSGGGVSGDGGDITLRGSDGNADGAVSGVVFDGAFTYSASGGVGGTGGAPGTVVID